MSVPTFSEVFDGGSPSVFGSYPPPDDCVIDSGPFFPFFPERVASVPPPPPHGRLARGHAEEIWDGVPLFFSRWRLHEEL